MLEPLNPPVVRVAESGCSDHPKEPDAPVVFHVGQILVLEDVQLARGWPTNLNFGFVPLINHYVSPRGMSSSQLW